ncbi:hypothetical protein Pelo_12711 [Pelomyxa schiedti]|nr:hypothetical protein Pelo_12711 [Pelomyxa schiedti]
MKTITVKPFRVQFAVSREPVVLCPFEVPPSSVALTDSWSSLPMVAAPTVASPSAVPLFDLSSLPGPLISAVIDQLASSPRDLLALGRTCRPLAGRTRSQDLWRRVFSQAQSARAFWHEEQRRPAEPWFCFVLRMAHAPRHSRLLLAALCICPGGSGVATHPLAAKGWPEGLLERLPGFYLSVQHPVWPDSGEPGEITGFEDLYRTAYNCVLHKKRIEFDCILEYILFHAAERTTCDIMANSPAKEETIQKYRTFSTMLADVCAYRNRVENCEAIQNIADRVLSRAMEKHHLTF